MLGDAHSTNYAENRDFFLNQNNPTNFERTWNTAYFLYKKINSVTQQTPFDQVMDFSVIQKLGAEAKYASQKNEYDVQFAPATAGSIQGEQDEILTRTVVIHFFPNSWDLNKKITRTVDGKEVEELYDPNVGFIVEEVGKLSGQYGAARIVIEGHSDGSMRGTVPKSLVQELSLNRANSVKEAIVRKFPSLQPNQFVSVRNRLGQARRCLGSGEPRQEPARGDQGLSGRGDDRQVDAARGQTAAFLPSCRPARDGAPAARRGDGRRSRPPVVARDGRRCARRTGSSRP